MNKISITDRSSNTILEEFELDQYDIAHQKAIQYEKLNIDVLINYPSSVEQLGIALGVSSNEIDGLKCEMNEELDSHN